MAISILNVVNNFEGLPHQVKALTEFDAALEGNKLVADDAIWVNTWRTQNKSVLVSVKSAARKDLVEAIKNQCAVLGVTLKTQIAYILATAEHESDRFMTMVEYASGEDYEGRDDLGNTKIGDGVRFKGRGLVQITGRSNYAKFANILTGYGENLNLVESPDLAARPDIAVFTLVYGMKNGVFTGKKLDDYITQSATDFYNARRIVNWVDRAAHIEAIARDWLIHI
jgi:hypothetical protein